MQNPDKPFKTYDEQVSILKSRNVYIKNEEIVKQCLTDISYYSLINGYKDLFDSDINGKFSYPVPFEYSMHSEPHRPALRATYSII